MAQKIKPGGKFRTTLSSSLVPHKNLADRCARLELDAALDPVAQAHMQLHFPTDLLLLPLRDEDGTVPEVRMTDYLVHLSGCKPFSMKELDQEDHGTQADLAK